MIKRSDHHWGSPTYIVRAALSEETNNGWIWLQESGQAVRFGYREVVVIQRPGCCRYVYTQVRNIDGNFRRQYNAEKHRIRIDPGGNVIVMAEWYRKALGIDDTSPTDHDLVPLVIRAASRWRFPELRAACHHPDLAIRLGTRLGVMSVWLAVFGLWLGVYPRSSLVICGVPVDAVRWLLFLGLLMLAFFACKACRGPKL